MSTYVIGLGGTGNKIILCLKRMIAENSLNGMKDFPSLKFLHLDFYNERTSNESPIISIPENELRLDLRTEVFTFPQTFNNKFNLKEDLPQISKWFPESLKHYLGPTDLYNYPRILERPLSRFVFAWNADILRQIIDDFLDSSDNDFISNVFICGSLCGFTGSGMFIDLAYLIKNIINQNQNKNFNVFGMFALSSFFDGVMGNQRIKSNCYASLTELDYFMNSINNQNPDTQFYPAYKNNETEQWDYSESSKQSPFDFPCLFDQTNNTIDDLPTYIQLYQVIAKFIYCFTDNIFFTQWLSVYNNIRANIDNTNLREKYNKPNNYCSMGTFSLLFPHKKVIQLCAFKLLDEYLKYRVNDSSVDYHEKSFLDFFEEKLNKKKQLLEDIIENPICELIFDYESDVEELYKTVILEKGESNIFNCLSEKLDSQLFQTSSSFEAFLQPILSYAQDLFKETVNKINIADKLLNNEEKLNLLLDGTYLKKSSYYLGLDENKLSEAGLNVESSVYHIITIPDNEYLKKMLYDNTKTSLKNTMIITTNQIAEINIITTLTGYPLAAVKSAVQDCKPDYDLLMKRNIQENQMRGVNEERLHVFGNLKFDDL